MSLYDVSTSEKKTSPSLVAGGTLYADNPLGTILPFGGSSIPSGWLLCDGTAVSRTTYSELFAVIGTAFGAGDGSTTFNIPDMRESVPKGAGLTGKTVGNHLDADGLAVGEFLDDQLQAHTHSNKTGSSTAGLDAWTMFASNRVETSVEQTNNGAVGRFGATTEVKSVGVNYIIKAKMAAVPSDFLAKVDEACNGKADKVSSATNGDIASLDANGNLVDSGASIKNGGNRVMAVKGYTTSDAIDLNALKEAGIYSITSQGATHLPNTDYLAWWQILVIPKSTTKATLGYCTQFAMARNNLIYMRDCEANTWSNWKKLVTESDLTPIIGTATPTAQLISGDVIYIKSGNVCTVCFNGLTVNTNESNRLICTGLPLPLHPTFFGCASNDTFYTMNVNADGTLRDANNTTFGNKSNIYGSLTYVCG